MKLAWKEIKHSISKYILIEVILVLMIFMVVFLSGLANGLGWAISASITQTDAEYFLVSKDAEQLITISGVDPSIIEEVQDSTSDKVSSINIKRSNITTFYEDAKLDITYYVTNEESFLMPKVTEGVELKDSKEPNPILIDDTFKDKGVLLGDIITDDVTGLEFSVVGFIHDQMHSHSPVAFISNETYLNLNLLVNSNYIEKYNAIAIQGSDVENIQINGYEVINKETLINKLPGYTAEQLTINMIIWVLVIVSSSIIGVFFYVITIQKLRQFGVLKAIGMTMIEISRFIISQVTILSLIGVILGNLVSIGMAAMLPSTMPYASNVPYAVIISIVFVVISVLTSILSVRKVGKVDPIVIIGGNE